MSDTDTPPAIPPFWHRLNKFFLFPMQTEALLYAFAGTCAWLLISFGLAQVRERLATLHGAAGALELIAVQPSGTSATVTFPLKSADTP